MQLNQLHMSYRIHISWKFGTGPKMEPVLDTNPNYKLHLKLQDLMHRLTISTQLTFTRDSQQGLQ